MTVPWSELMHHPASALGRVIERCYAHPDKGDSRRVRSLLVARLLQHPQVTVKILDYDFSSATARLVHARAKAYSVRFLNA